MVLPINKSVESRKVCSVIVTHNPAIECFKTIIKSVKDQVDIVVIIDNNSIPTFSVSSKKDKFIIEQLPENTGIAVAQNIGISIAKSEGCTHIVFMDQDSNPAPNMISKLFEACNSLHAKGYCISATGPTHLDPVTRNTARFIQLGNFKFRHVNNPDLTGYIPADFLISSGSLISMDVLEDVGLMDESLFIDRVDTEWFLRARAKGYQAFGVPDAIMNHSLGENTWKVWFGRWRYVPEHKPFRHYYTFRNSILLYKRSYIPLQWKINDAIKLIYIFVFSVACMPERWKRATLILHGICDGLRGVTGKLECADA